MSDEIRPALSAEEWAQRRTPLGNTDGTSFIDVGHSDGLCVGGSGTYHEVLNRHGTAALALYGQPFGFTWEIHDAIMWAISDYESEAGFMDEHQQREHAAMLRGLAIIASLLPPREEG